MKNTASSFRAVFARVAGKFRRPRHGAESVWGAALLLFVATRFGDAVNAVTGIWLVPKYVPQEQLGAVLPLAQVAAFVAMPLSLVLTPYAKLLNVHAERGETGKVKAMVRDASLCAAVALAVALVLVPLFLPLVFDLFGIENGNLALAIVLSAVLGALSPIFVETMRALKRFSFVSFCNAATPLVRFAAMTALLPLRGLTGYFAGQCSVPVFLSAASLASFLRGSRGTKPEKWWRDDRAVFFAFLAPMAALVVSGNVRGMVEVLPFALMPKIESAAWYQLTRFSDIAAYMGGAIVFVLFPVASSRHERGEDTLPLLLRAMALVLCLGTALSVALALAGRALFSSVGFLAPYAGFAGWLLPLGVLASVRTATGCFTAHEMACARFSFLRYTVPITLVEALAVWVACKSGRRFGPDVWHIAHVWGVMTCGAVATLAGNAVEIARRRSRAKGAL